MPIFDPLATRITERREARLDFLEREVIRLEREKKFAVEQIDHLCEEIAEKDEKIAEYRSGMRFVLSHVRSQAETIRRLKRSVYQEAA